jgi:glycosyltransferase involved in cell wall biosynthesis
MFRNPGGDTIQLNYTKKYLEDLGVKVDIANSVHQNMCAYDLIHVFNITRIEDTYIYCKSAKQKQIPIVLSPIYWDKKEFRQKCYYDFRSYISAKYSNCFEALNSFKKKQKTILEMSDLILPNSQIEKYAILINFGVNLSNFDVVYNVVEPIADPGSGCDFLRNFLNNEVCDDFILCVAALNPRKNTHRLIQAVKYLDTPLILIGKQEDRYLKFCRSISDENVFFLGHVNHADLPFIYSAAKVHVLPSWFETPGLSSLEAAIYGCNIVTTNRGTALEYFGDLAYYCDPSDPDTITTAIVNAFKEKVPKELQTTISRKYTWPKIAEDTLNNYLKIL